MDKTSSRNKKRKYDQYSAFDSKKYESSMQKRKRWKNYLLFAVTTFAILVLLAVAWLYTR